MSISTGCNIAVLSIDLSALNLWDVTLNFQTVETFVIFHVLEFIKMCICVEGSIKWVYFLLYKNIPYIYINQQGTQNSCD